MPVAAEEKHSCISSWRFAFLSHSQERLLSTLAALIYVLGFSPNHAMSADIEQNLNSWADLQNFAHWGAQVCGEDYCGRYVKTLWQGVQCAASCVTAWRMD